MQAVIPRLGPRLRRSLWLYRIERSPLRITTIWIQVVAFASSARVSRMRWSAVGELDSLSAMTSRVGALGVAPQLWMVG